MLVSFFEGLGSQRGPYILLKFLDHFHIIRIVKIRKQNKRLCEK